MNQHPATWAWAQDLKGLSKLVLLGLADYSGTKNKAAFPSFETLADKCDISRTSVYNAIKKLTDGGFISVKTRYEEGRKVSNLYTLNLDLSSDVRTKKSDLSSDVRTKKSDLSSDVRTKAKTPEKSDLSSKLSSNLSSDGCTITTIKNHNNEPKEKGGVQKSKEVEFPSELDTSEFRKQWELYETYRTENRFKRLKPSSIQTKLSEMAEWGHETAMDAVRQTIGNGWQGIFAPKSISSKPRAEGAPQPKESSAQKPRSTWDIKQQIEAIDDRLNELRKHRAEVAGGDYVWDSPDIKDQYRALFSKRKQLNAQLINQ